MLWQYVVRFVTHTYTLTTVGIGCAVLGLLYKFQNNMLYVCKLPNLPHHTTDNPVGYRSPADDPHHLPFDDLRIRTADGVSLHAWLVKAAKPTEARTLIFFHGNAGNMGFRMLNLARLHKGLNAGPLHTNILIVDYRGYGNSEGEPNEEGLMLDAEAVLKFARNHDTIHPDRLVLFGRSLGGAVAVYLASKFPDQVAGLVVENTFYNVTTMVDKLFAWLSVFKNLVLRIYWPSNERMPRVTAPVLIIRGMKDTLVPPAHSRQLYDLATAARTRKLYTVDDGGHNDTWQKGGVGYLMHLQRWLMDYVPVADDAPPSGPAPGADPPQAAADVAADADVRAEVMEPSSPSAL